MRTIAKYLDQRYTTVRTIIKSYEKNGRTNRLLNYWTKVTLLNMRKDEQNMVYKRQRLAKKMQRRMGYTSGINDHKRTLTDDKRDAMMQMCDEQDSDYLEQRCPLFLYEYDKEQANNKIELAYSLCDNETKKYPFALPVNGTNPRNFENIEEEVEKVDYDIGLIDANPQDLEVKRVEQLPHYIPDEDKQMVIPYEFEQNQLDSKLYIFQGTFAHLNDLNKVMQFEGLQSDATRTFKKLPEPKKALK